MDSTLFTTHVFYGMTLASMGRFDQATAELELATRMDDNPQALAQKGWVYARAGRRADALAVVDTVARRTRATSTFYPDYDVASIYAAIGDRDHAFASLERAFAVKSEALLWIRNDPRFDPLRTARRFADLLRGSLPRV